MLEKLFQPLLDVIHHEVDAKSSPYIIGITGSVAVGKSTTSKMLRQWLSQWPEHPQVALINTDGFLLSAQTLSAHNLMRKKGFPESYDNQQMTAFLTAIKRGEGPLTVPIYSHRIYDLTGEVQSVQVPDILIMEGLNILQQPEGLLDFIIYIDAPTAMIASWYLERFKGFREAAKQDPGSFFHQFTLIPEDDALMRAQQTWENINEANLLQNILPLKHRARAVVEKGEGHTVKKIDLKIS